MSSKKAKKPKAEPASQMFMPSAGYTGTEIATRLARPVIRFGTQLTMQVIDNQPKVAAWKHRWVLGAGAAVLGMLGELTLADTVGGRLLKAPAEGLTNFGLLHLTAQLFPTYAAKMGLSGIGGSLDNMAGTEDSDPNEWARIAAQIQAEESQPMAGTDQPEGRGANWVEEVEDDDLGELDDDDDDDPMA